MKILWMKRAGTDLLAGEQHLAFQQKLGTAGHSLVVQQHQARAPWRGTMQCDWLIWGFVPSAMDVWGAKVFARRQLGLLHAIGNDERTLPGLDQWCVPSESLRTAIMARGVASRQISIWQGYASYPMRREHLAGTLEKVIYVPGPLEASSGSLLAVWALRIVQYLHPEVRMVLHGNGAMMERVASFAASTCETGSVTFNKHSTVHDLMSRADAVWIPQMVDGVPDALFSALGQGKPILAADQPSLREWLQHNENAILLPPDNAPKWARAMHRLLTEEGLGKRLGLAASRTAIPSTQHELPAFLGQTETAGAFAQAA